MEIQKEKNSNINLLYIDLFCGAGGTSTGVESARFNSEQCAKVIACVNHDANAIASHAANHPDALHFTEDIRTLELTPLIAHIEKCKKQYHNALIVLWASLECTNFSKAKGGQPRDADSRTLAEHLFRYIEAINPDYIQIENVEEFMAWGPMDKNGKPISMQKGKDYTRWVRNVKSYDYNFDHRILNAADFGAYTSRKRFFGIFAKKGLPIVWPEPTHCKEGKQDMFSSLAKWKAVKDVLDFDDEGTSIFTRKKPLSEKTLERIYAGLIKFVAGGKDKWLLKYNSINGKTGRHIPPSVDEPCPTVSCQGRLGMVQANFLSRYNTCRPEDTCKSVNDPCGVLTTHNRFAKIGCHFLSKYYSGHPESKNIPVTGPAHTIKCKDNHSLIGAKFLSAYYGNGHNHSMNKPSPVVTTKDRLSYITPKFLCSYNFNDAGKDVNAPCPTVLTKDRFSLVCPTFIDMQYGNGTPTSIRNPAGTVTANPKHKLVTVKPWVMGSSVNDPCFTLIARMDKRPPHIVVPQKVFSLDTLPDFVKMDGQGNIFIDIYEDDSSMTKKIKEFMVVYGITDILMRMLKILELLRIMGFPQEYKLIGTQADQKKFIGNAVEVTMARVMCEALSRKIEELRIAA